MQCLLLITLVAGLCSAEGDVSEYSDCATVNDIATKKCENHLHYLKELHSDSYNFFMDIAKLQDPIDLANSVVVEKACNKSDDLGNYYDCVFTNLGECLRAVHSVQASRLPVPARAAEAIKTLCINQKDLNRTCYNQHKVEIDKCALEKFQENQKMMGGMPMPEGEAGVEGGDEEEEDDEEEGVDHSNHTPEEHNTYQTQQMETQLCTTYDGLLGCLDKGMSGCGGYETTIRQYYLRFRPAACPETSSASLVGPLSLVSLLLSFLCSRLL